MLYFLLEPDILTLKCYVVRKIKFQKNLETVDVPFFRVSQGGRLFPCSLPKLPYVPVFPNVFLICSPFNEFAYNVVVL